MESYTQNNLKSCFEKHEMKLTQPQESHSPKEVIFTFVILKSQITRHGRTTGHRTGGVIDV